MPQPQPDPKTMTLAQINAEFKQLANELEPIASRRTALDREQKDRIKKGKQSIHFHALSRQDKEDLYYLLKEDLEL
ncbi:hypothetical protein LCGC14_1804140 [marine sediment metagenome]|uniref:Uncharacterized protein n=1 Tax=marine sediment metagenome TaxID=412755 RepID=A0A0F9GNM5_9ZZZZ